MNVVSAGILLETISIQAFTDAPRSFATVRDLRPWKSTFSTQ